jgi:hypothetical protein
VSSAESVAPAWRDAAELGAARAARLEITLRTLVAAVRKDFKPLECSDALFAALGVAERELAYIDGDVTP